MGKSISKQEWKTLPIGHGPWWVVCKNQKTGHAHTGQGARKKRDGFTIPLMTIESNDEFSNSQQRTRAIRWFEPL